MGGNVSADDFATAVCSHRPGLVHFARRYGNTAAAEDLAHDTIVKALQARERFDGRNLSAWLLRILVNHHHTLHRKAKFETNAPPPHEPTCRHMGEFTCDAATALKHVCELPRSYRDVLLSLAWNDGVYPDVARDLGIAHGTVKSGVSRGRALMRAKFATSEAA